MWLKGDRTRPTFNYRVIEDAAGAALDDRAVHARRGRERRIASISLPRDAAATRFVRRGRGLLSLASSRWQAMISDDNHDVVVVVFEKALLTPTGADILARMPDLSDVALQQVVHVMSCMVRHPDTASQAGRMRRMPTP